jgi:outer membrane protein assembly factor BamA
MNNKKYYLFFFLSSALLWAGCSNTKHLPVNEKLYDGAKVQINGPDLSARQKKVLRSDLKGLTRPRPNSKILGMRIKLSIYNLFRNKKPKSFWGKIRSKYGEPPVLLSQVDIPHNVKLLQNHQENKGYFHAQVTGDTIVKRKIAKAVYKSQTGPQYTINKVEFPTDTNALSAAIAQSAKNTLLKPGTPFDLDVIKGERLRIDNFLKERGFYFFSPDYLIVNTDSTIGNNKVNMYVAVKPETPDSSRDVYRINNVYIYSGYSLNANRRDTSKSSAVFTNGYYLIDRRKRFKPSLFQRAMQFDPGDVYNRTDHNQTLNRLINLNEFKFVNNRFTVAATDSPRLDVSYYLTPLPGKSLRAEVTTINRSNNLNGSEVRFSWLNRNLFHGGEQVSLSAYIGSDVQFSGALSGYNTYRTGAELDFTIPRFISPFGEIPTDGGFMPRTVIRLGYDILQRSRLYTLNSYRFEYGYNWKPNIQQQYQFSPISINYVQPLNVTDKYRALEDTFPGLERAIEQQFILGTNFQYTYNQLANGLQPRNAFYFNGLVDLSGNIAGLITQPDIKKGDTAKIANAPFSQYIKFELDGRYYRNLGLKSTWANRIDIGIGYPYGNSVQIPYVKQFFVGGNNSLRGFRSRAVGPGKYHFVGTNNNTIIPDQTGDIKLEMNTELRPHIGGPLYGALFVDAGNIWLASDTIYTHKPGSKFTSKFLSDLAVDVGVGVRLDITIFVIRLDVGFPIRKPWEDNPWVINQIRFKDATWRRENIVYNLAIGYPF